MSEKPFRNYHVAGQQRSQTLSSALRAFVPDKSWAQLKKLIAGRHVQVNGNLCLDENRKVKAGDVIKLWDHPLARPADASDLRIRYVDAHLVVVEKPAGVTTLRHAEERSWPARRKQMQPTLDELLPRALAKHLGWNIPEKDLENPHPQKKIGSRRGRDNRQGNRSPKSPKLPTVRAVHRLDRDTSGLIVFARTPDTEYALIRLFSKHRIKRSYLAVVHGQVTNQTIDTYIVRDRGDGLRGSTLLGPEAEGAQRAVTHVEMIEAIGNYSLIRCRLETGRTHQIRIHLSECGHMLCGEKVYTHKLGDRPQIDQSGAPRQALHAAELGFVHPATTQAVQLQTPLPKDLAAWLRRLKATT
jgi:23S rRNA pseudouridine1911/1915/1917 synthase